MPANLELLENGHVISAVIAVPWQLQDVLDAYATETTWRDQAAWKLHTILDLRRATPAPKGVLSLSRQSPSLIHPRRGAVAIVGGSAFGRTIVEMACRIAGFNQIRFFATPEQAWDYIRQVIAGESTAQVTVA